MFTRCTYFKIPVKIDISPGQALLILIDKYDSNITLVNELKSLYLLGAEDEKSRARIKLLLRDKALVNYNISFEPIIISEDPTRRYFESYLSYFTLYSSINKLEKEDLEFTSKKMYLMLPVKKQSKINNFLTKKPKDSQMKIEFQDNSFKINSHPSFDIFSNPNKLKLNKLNLMAYMAVILIQNQKGLPLRIYTKGYYPIENNSRIIKSNKDQKDLRSCGLGLMKSYMDLPKNDLLFNEDVSNYTRVTDRNSFKENSPWADYFFSKLVHPFSASISGTILAFIRFLAYLYDNEELRFDDAEKLKTLFKCYISLLLFSSGGHSLYEFIAPINIPEVQEHFRLFKGFADINLNSLFLQENTAEFDMALYQTIEYNKLILNKKWVNLDINILISGESQFLAKKIEIMDNLNSIKKKFINKTNILFLVDTKREIISDIDSAIANISKNTCKNDYLIEEITTKLQTEIDNKISSNTKELMKIFEINDLSSHSKLDQENRELLELNLQTNIVSNPSYKI